MGVNAFMMCGLATVYTEWHPAIDSHRYCKTRAATYSTAVTRNRNEWGIWAGSCWLQNRSRMILSLNSPVQIFLASQDEIDCKLPRNHYDMLMKGPRFSRKTSVSIRPRDGILTRSWHHWLNFVLFFLSSQDNSAVAVSTPECSILLRHVLSKELVHLAIIDGSWSCSLEDQTIQIASREIPASLAWLQSRNESLRCRRPESKTCVFRDLEDSFQVQPVIERDLPFPWSCALRALKLQASLQSV